MTIRIMTTVAAAILCSVVLALPAQARCKDSGACEPQTKKSSIATKRKLAVRPWGTKQRRRTVRLSTLFTEPAARAVRPWGTRQRRAALPVSYTPGAARAHGNVAAIIASEAPRFGVPAWFALRIAHVESGYNPAARGAAGEFGVFQLKCETAKLIGYEGECAGLLNAGTNVQFGLKHLSLAISRSDGNLRMAASKHNGGLGRRTLVTSYVNKVF